MQTYKEWLSNSNTIALEGTFVYCPYIPFQMSSASTPTPADIKAIDQRAKEIQKKLDIDINLTFKEEIPGSTRKFLQDWQDIINDTVSKK